MDIYKPVSTIMSTNLITVAQEDKLSAIKDIFKEHRIHHIPVVSGDKLIGILSKSDFLNATHGVSLHGDANEENEEIYNALKVSEAGAIITVRFQYSLANLCVSYPKHHTLRANKSGSSILWRIFG